ncbi:hypothetical protein M0R45_002734 [Rubus argutus]|uniref:Uncharacterized protein n=1 Tax=Rubus argutus TaxID=59490 RepID=A0AAW1VM08_RUBAR
MMADLGFGLIGDGWVIERGCGCEVVEEVECFCFGNHGGGKGFWCRVGVDCRLGVMMGDEHGFWVRWWRGSSRGRDLWQRGKVGLRCFCFGVVHGQLGVVEVSEVMD